MAYLYGDSTPSNLGSNFLEFLRDALDFCVYILQSDSRIRNGRERMEDLRRQATLELGQLEAFGQEVRSTIESAPKGAPDSPTVECAVRLASLTEEAVRGSMQSVRDRLAADIERAEAEEADERDGCESALATLLIPHHPPDASAVVQLVHQGNDGYGATLEGQSGMGFGWRFELEIPEGHLFATTLVVERIVPHFHLLAPELTGWIRKEVKMRPQRLERYAIAEAVDDDATITLKLRAEGGAGFDLEVDLEASGVQVSRAGPSEDVAAGPFEPNDTDVPKLVELGKTVHRAIAALPRKRLTGATFDDIEFRALESFVVVVERMVAAMAPVCEEISRRSLEPTELVLRRLLADDRREEIFVAKATLLQKLSPLVDHHRALFDPLGLDPARASRSALPAPPDERTQRSELPPSQPPRPPVKATQADRPLPPAALPRISPPPAQTHDSAPEIELAAERGSVEPDSTRLRVGGQRNPEIVATLKRIMASAKEGRTDDAYREYAALFDSPVFADAPLEERRQLLRVMLFAKAPPVITDAFREAHRAALERIRLLVERSGEPGDYEMLGICELVLQELGAAAAAFQKALDIERRRNPHSELCGSLMRRVASL